MVSLSASANRGDDVNSKDPVGLLVSKNLDEPISVHVALRPAVCRHGELANLVLDALQQSSSMFINRAFPRTVYCGNNRILLRPENDKALTASLSCSSLFPTQATSGWVYTTDGTVL